MLSIAGISRQVAFEKKQDKLNPKKTAPRKIAPSEDCNHLCYIAHDGTEIPTDNPKALKIIQKINSDFHKKMKAKRPRSFKELVATKKIKI
ncbi:MAG TPA: hypothetical protein PLG15_01405 [Candidatus Gastranaerophilaceae bacterium]|nr:hypothetical protein [Candidatus Gastranaerophilaceae bacterium]HPT41024.1 hypothetical protein [Candidatus Gastranaerophilaceae bacterium]